MRALEWRGVCGRRGRLRAAGSAAGGGVGFGWALAALADPYGSGPERTWTFWTIGSHLVVLVDVLDDGETFSVSQSSETSILISQSSKTSIRGPDLHSQSSISSTTTPFVLPIVENVHGPDRTPIAEVNADTS